MAAFFSFEDREDTTMYQYDAFDSTGSSFRNG